MSSYKLKKLLFSGHYSLYANQKFTLAGKLMCFKKTLDLEREYNFSYKLDKDKRAEQLAHNKTKIFRNIRTFNIVSVVF